jgi:hypothetical protein
MSQENTSVNAEATEAADQTNNQAEKTFTQAEVNAILAKTKTQLEKKISSKFEDLGDPDELREIVSSYRKQQQDQQMKKGEFEKVLQDVVSKKDSEIQKRDRMIEEFKVNTPILDAAARLRAVAPDQVKALVRSNVRLNGEGEVEVVDGEGKVRYDDSGRPLSVDSYIQEFLSKNPHFVQPTPSTTSARSTVGARNEKLDISKLDMKNPEHRKIYADYRKSAGLA